MYYPPDDIELINRFKKGNEEAVREIHKMFYRPLCYFVNKIAGNHHEAEDIATESFLKVWQRHQDFESAAGIRSFLFTTARNMAINLIRQKKIHERNHRQILYLNDQGEEFTVNDEAEAEILRVIYDEIEALPPQCREIFRLLSFDGLDTSQVADQLGLSPQTVRNQKAKAIHRLRSAVLKANLSANMLIIHFILKHWS